MSVETYTIREAAELCGVTVVAMRKRVDRGGVRAVLSAGVRRIPHSELERAGLLAGARERELEATVQRLRAEIVDLRLIPEQLETTWRAKLTAEEQAREQAQTEYHRAQMETLAANALLEHERADALRARELASAMARGSWLERRRARKAAHAELAVRPSAPMATAAPLTTETTLPVS
jgi:ribosomal protein L16 Arg81 hydroxylase